jgi:Family of unknown function (DUF6513)/Pterin binding enzyme
MSHAPLASEKVLFVTGRLAEQSLRRIVEALAAQIGFAYSIQVMPITVAALLTPDWIAPRIDIPSGTTKIILPGYCHGDLTRLQERAQIPIEFGPRDLRRLPEFFGKSVRDANYGKHTIEIIAEINHAPRLPLSEILSLADQMRTDGADIIDVGCEPGEPWLGAGECVRQLKLAGHRVSIDSLHPDEIEPAVKAGAELVLSVNTSNRNAAIDWGCEVVAIPDLPSDLASLYATVEWLSAKGVRLRVDPILCVKLGALFASPPRVARR